ncbi:lytic transglycosylase domain-containing protein [Sphingopyxis chilensis]|uniref:lytic transglycosylase domain-containing protein n=1 Tax=Sphingopyxis chilensis TaxID=180400 RepID=UPI002DDD0717|nr:lytic transglycosylase domain-containing protein [Sphingopyxis chilensis]
MAPLRVLWVAVLLLAASPAQADPVVRWHPYIAEASDRLGVPVEWIEWVIRAESGGRTRAGGSPITSRAGAMGLMQLMPGTWKSMRDRLDLGPDPHDPRDNILAGTFYLKLMHARFGYPGMFAAYNAGPGRYAAYLAGRSRLPGETVAYVRTVTGMPTQHSARTESAAVFVSKVQNRAALGGADRSNRHADIFFIHRPQR